MHEQDNEELSYGEIENKNPGGDLIKFMMFKWLATCVHFEIGGELWC